MCRNRRVGALVVVLILFFPLLVLAALEAAPVQERNTLGKGASVWAAKKSGWQQLTSQQRTDVGAFADGYKAYMGVAKTALLSTREVMRLARAAGFAEFTD